MTWCQVTGLILCVFAFAGFFVSVFFPLWERRRHYRRELQIWLMRRAAKRDFKTWDI